LILVNEVSEYLVLEVVNELFHSALKVCRVVRYARHRLVAVDCDVTGCGVLKGGELTGGQLRER
jgi:hypothetical protein